MDAQGIVITWPRNGEPVAEQAAVHKVDKRTAKDTPMQRKAIKKAAATEQLARRVSNDSGTKSKSLVDESSNAGDVSGEDSEVVSGLEPICVMLFCSHCLSSSMHTIRSRQVQHRMSMQAHGR